MATSDPGPKPEPQPEPLYCPRCDHEVARPIICGDCGAVICNECGSSLERMDELGIG